MRTLIGAHPKEESYYFFFSRCDKALPAMLFVRLLERPSRKAFDASFATFTEVTFLAIAIKLNQLQRMNLPPSLASPLLVELTHHSISFICITYTAHYERVESRT